MTDSNGPRPTMSRRDLLRTAGVAGAAALIPDAVDAVTEGSPATSSPAPVGEERSVGRSVAIRHGAITCRPNDEFDGQ